MSHSEILLQIGMVDGLLSTVREVWMNPCSEKATAQANLDHLLDQRLVLMKARDASKS